MEWSAFIDDREARRGHALEAADRLLGGEPLEDGWLGGWRFGGDSALVDQVAARLLASPPTPEPEHLSAALAPPDVLPSPLAAEQPRRLLRRHLHRRCAASVPDDARHRLAWGVDSLGWLGDEVERLERAAWRGTEYPDDPERDAASAALWAGWFSGDPWSGQSRWVELYLPAATRVFRGVLASRKIPDAVSRRVIEDLDDHFFFFLLGGREGTPGWRELAVRVIETSAWGPVDALATILPTAEWSRLARCATRRGRWPETAAMIWPDRSAPAAWGAALEQRRRQAPEFLETALDLHVVARLIANWSAGSTDPDQSWQVVTQNRGRARGRLRALATGAALLEPLLALDGLHARTLEATRRFAWAWAWSELSRDFPFDMDRAVTPPCQLPDDAPDALSAEDDAALDTWTLLVCLKGHLPTLTDWVLHGRGNRSATWGRLLSEDLPGSLRAPNPRSPTRAYARIKTDLAASLCDRLDRLTPRLEAIAALSTRRGLRARFEALVTDHWRGVNVPRAGFPTFVKNAAGALRWLEEQELEP